MKLLSRDHLLLWGMTLLDILLVIEVMTLGLVIVDLLVVPRPGRLVSFDAYLPWNNYKITMSILKLVLETC